MITSNYTEFRKKIKSYLVYVVNNHETLIITRGAKKATVTLSLDEYNSIMETLYLLSSKKDVNRLYESILQLTQEKGYPMNKWKSTNN